ncbi:MAG TPA: hypothetical protein VMS17_25365 [Gemmataceae bacterium]|nr:hypothetical protein [Gemmataceae bacterium]
MSHNMISVLCIVCAVVFLFFARTGLYAVVSYTAATIFVIVGVAYLHIGRRVRTR